MPRRDDNTAAAVIELIQNAKGLSVTLSQRYASEGKWDRAQAFLAAGQTLDRVVEQLPTNGAPVPAGQPIGATSVARIPSAARTAYYYIDEDYCLAKLGRSRNGGGYKHRITRDSLETIMRDIAQAADPIYTPSLLQACERPDHEPRLVIDLLIQKGHMRKLGRGRYRLVTRNLTADQLCGELPREITPRL